MAIPASNGGRRATDHQRQGPDAQVVTRHEIPRQTVGLVPTMGYLHDGHVSLIREARTHADVLAVSIYVNPGQFSPSEDLSTYPSDFHGDIRKLTQIPGGVDVVYNPHNLYDYGTNTDAKAPASNGARASGGGETVSCVEEKGAGHETWVRVERLEKGMWGRSRPVFFRGAATVVSKLFNIVEPDVAVFGKKNYQQWRIIQRMSKISLWFPSCGWAPLPMTISEFLGFVVRCYSPRPSTTSPTVVDDVKIEAHKQEEVLMEELRLLRMAQVPTNFKWQVTSGTDSMSSLSVCQDMMQTPTMDGVEVIESPLEELDSALGLNHSRVVHSESSIPSRTAAKKKGFDVMVFEKDLSAVRGEGQYRGLIQIQSNALAALEAIDVDVADEVMRVGCVTGYRINGLVYGVSGTWYVKFDTFTHAVERGTFTPAVERGLPVTRVISRMTLQLIARAVGDHIIINGSNVVNFEDVGEWRTF